MRSSVNSRVVIVRRDGQALIWSRQRKDLTDRFPDVEAAAVRELPHRVALDGVI